MSLCLKKPDRGYVKLNNIVVFDEYKKKFRPLNRLNCSGAISIGAVLFERNAVELIKKYFIVCGFVLISKRNRTSYPIDIHSDKIVLLEGTYNSFPRKLKKDLAVFNISEKTDKIWSAFFIKWQFLGLLECFNESSPFIQMCLAFWAKDEIISKMIDNDISIIEPCNYLELCALTKHAIFLSGADFFSVDYVIEKKYLIDSLIHCYRINFSPDEIDYYTNQICYVINHQMGEVTDGI